MRLPLLCSTCITMARTPQECTVFTTANDSGVYELVCHLGHRSTLVIVATKYEVLFETALSAINDQYYREAVSSFAAALERFFEFSTAVIAESSGVSGEAFSSTWKHLSRQSERQLGAYAMAFLVAEKCPPLLLPQKATELRNDVIHKGKVPTLDEALRFGDDVLHVIRSTLNVLHDRHPSTLQDHLMKPHLDALRLPALVGKAVNRNHLSLTLRQLKIQEVHGPRDTRFYAGFLAARHGMVR
jgi:hypothetical protein